MELCRWMTSLIVRPLNSTSEQTGAGMAGLSEKGNGGEGGSSGGEWR